MSDAAILDCVHRALHRLLGGRAFLQPAGLLGRLADASGLDVAAVRRALGHLAARDVVAGVSGRGDPIGRVALRVPPDPEPAPLAPGAAAWIARVAGSGVDPAFASALSGLAEDVQDLAEPDQDRLLHGLIALRCAHPDGGLDDPFAVSARFLLGSSKILPGLGKRLDSAGLSAERFAGRPRYVLVAGPPSPQAVLLIENPGSFEAFCRSRRVGDVMGVCVYGYALAWAGLADATARRRLIDVRRLGDPPPFADVIERVPVYFWGDLDREGLNIFLALRAVIPGVTLSGLYAPMVEALAQSERSHPYCRLAAKTGQGPVGTNDDPMVAHLARLCAERAVDQELVPIEEIDRRAAEAYSIARP